MLEQGPRLTEAAVRPRRVRRRSCRRATPTTRRRSRRRSAPRRRTRRGRHWTADLRPAGGWQQRAFHRQFLAPASDRFQRGQRARRRARAPALADWPITYEELEPYYTKAEWELGVSGEPGPFDPPRSRPYPMPPLPVKSSGVLLERGARALGLHPQPTPMAINSQPYNGRPACQHCGFCLFFMCEFRSKSTSMVTMLPLAEATGRCEIRPDSYVARVEIGPDGRATGVVYFDAQKRLQLQRAKAVVLCANGAETPRLLLNSESSRFPQRPGELQRRGRQAPDVQHLFRGQRAVRAPAQRVQERAEHPHGASTSTRPIRGAASTAAAASTRGSASTRSCSRSADCRRDRRRGARASRAASPSSSRARCSSARTARRCRSRRTASRIDPSLKDAWGLPCMRVTYKDHPDDLKMRAVPGRRRPWRSRRRPARSRPGPSRFSRRPSRCTCSAPAGWATTRGPRSIDRYHRTHDVRNLFICDGSSMVTSSRGQPTETISALAFRAGEHIAAFARRGENLTARRPRELDSQRPMPLPTSNSQGNAHSGIPWRLAFGGWHLTESPDLP